MTILKNARKLSDEDLKQVTGGGVYCDGLCQQAGVWAIVDDNTGNVINRVTRRSLTVGCSMAVQKAQACGQSIRPLSWAELNRQSSLYASADIVG